MGYRISLRHLDLLLTGAVVLAQAASVGVPAWLVPLASVPFLPWPTGWDAWRSLVLVGVPALGLIVLLARRSDWRLPEWSCGWWRPLLVLLAAFLVRLINLQGRALWYDEAFAVLYASLDPERMMYGTVTPVAGAGAADVHPLLYYFLLHGWMGLVGRSPLAIRFLSVGLGMVAVALLWRLAAWCFGPRTGLAVGILAAVNPFHVAYSQEARMYALLGLAAVTAARGLLRALQEGHLRWWVLYAAGAVLTLYAHNLGAFVLLALHLLAVSRRRWWRRLPALALADLAPLALFGPWLVRVLPGQVGFVERGYWLGPPGVEDWVRATMFPVLTFYEPVPMWLVGLGLFMGVLLLALLILQTWRTRSRAGWFLLLCWGPVLLLFLVSRWRPVYLERALLPSALFYLVAVGWLLARGGLPRFLSLGLTALLAVITVGSLAGHYAYARFPRPPFQEVAAYLQDRVEPDDVVVHTNKLTYFPTHVYAPDLPNVFLADPPGSPQDTLALPTQQALGIFATPTIGEAVGEAEQVWLIYFTREVDEMQALGMEHPALVWLQGRFVEVARKQFADLAVVRYRREGF
jgi:mannosyltransferase